MSWSDNRGTFADEASTITLRPAREQTISREPTETYDAAAPASAERL